MTMVQNDLELKCTQERIAWFEGLVAQFRVSVKRMMYTRRVMPPRRPWLACIKLCRVSQRRETAGEIFHRLVAEIRVRVIGEECSVDHAVLYPSKIFFACPALHFAVYVDVFLIRLHCPPV